MNTPTHFHKTGDQFCRRIVRAWTMSPATPFALLFAAFTLWCTPAQAQFAQPLYAYTFTAGKAATYDLPTLSGATAYSTDIGGSANFSVDVTSTPPALLSEVELGQQWYVETHTFVYTATAQNANGDAVDYAAQIELMVQPQLQIISSEYPYYFQQQLPRHHKTIHKIVAYGGLQPHTWAVTPALPSELALTLDASGATIDGFLPDNSASVHTFSVTDALGATDSAEIDIRSATHRAVNFHQPDSAYFVTFTAGTATSHELVDITGNTVHLDEKTPMRIGAYTVNLGNGFYRGASSDSLASHEHRVYSTTSIAAGQVTQFVLYNAGLDFENDFIDERSAVNFILIVVAKPAFNIPDQYLTVDTPYAATFTAAGGYGGLTYAIAADAPPLPPGMTLTATAGGVVLSGMPTAPGGQQTYRITATDENGGVGEGVVYIRDFSFIGFEQTFYRYTFAVGSLSQFDLPTRLGVSDWHVAGDLDEGIRFDTAQMPPIIYNDLFVAPGLHTFKYTALGAAFETVEIEAWVWDASFHSYEFTAGHASTLTLPTLPGASGYVVDLPPDQTTSAYTFARTLTYDLTANPPTISKAADTIAGATTYTAGIFTFWLRPSGDGAAVPAARIEIMVNEPLGFASRESAYDWHKSGGSAAHKEYTFTATGGTAPFFFAITPSPKSNKLTFVSVAGTNIARLFGADPAQRNYAIEVIDGLGATATHQITVRTRSLNSYETYDNQSRSLTFTAGAAVTFKMQDLYPSDWQKWVDHNRDFDTTDLPTGLNAGLAACTYDVTRDDVFCYLRNINSTTAVIEGASAIIYLNNLSQPGPCTEFSTSCGVHTQSNVDAALYLTTAPQPHIDIDRINLTAATAVDQTYTALGAFPFTFAAAADNPITPPGLTIEPTEAALVFRGAAYAPLPDRQYVYAITDNNGISNDATFTLQIGPYFELPLYAITFSGGVAGLHNLPQASGAIASYVHTLNYTGLTFDAADDAVNGLMLRSQTNTATGDVTFNLTAHVNDAVFAQTKIAVHIAAPPAFAANVQTTFEVATDIAVDFALPQLEQGVMPVGYGITGYLPDGLRLEAVNNFAARIIGTPTRAHGADAMLHAIDAAGATTQIPIHIIVRDRPGFAPFVVDATYTVNFATYSADGAIVADTITLPTAEGGAGELTYSLDAANQLPGGITATELADNRIIISGTPTETGEFVYTRYVTDSAIPSPRQATFTLQFTVIPPPSFGALTADNLNVSRGRQVYELLPRAASPLPLVYSLAPTPPDGITFDAEAVALIGAPTTPDGGALFTLSVIDSHGASASLPAFSIRVVDTPMFDALSGTTHFTYTRNTTFAQPYTFAPSTVGGAPPFQHRFFDVDIRALDLGDYADIDALRDAVRATLSVDGGNNGIIDPPLHTVGEFELRYSRVDANDAIGKSGFVTFSIIPRVQYESDPLGPFAFVRGAGGEYVFDVVGGIGDVTHRITPALPSGIEFSGERVLTLAQTASAAVMPETDYTLHITDANGETGMSEMSIRVVAAAPTFAQNLYALTFVQSVKNVLTLPRADGESTDTLTYRLADTDIAEYAQLGLTFSSVNGAYPITVTNREDALPSDFAKTFSAYFNADSDAALGVSETTLTFQFFAAPTFAATPTNITFTRSGANAYTFAAIDPATGAPPIAYTFLPTDIDAIDIGGYATEAELIAEVTGALNNGGIIAAPFTQTGEFAMRYTATDTLGAIGTTDFVTFTIVDPPRFTAPLGTYVFTPGTDGTWTLPPTEGGFGAHSIRIDPPLPNGLTLSNIAPPMLQQPDGEEVAVMDLTVYTMTVSDANGASADAEFSIQVGERLWNPYFWLPREPQKENYTFTQTVATDLTLPQHTVALSYAAIYYYGFADNTELDAQLEAMGLSITERFNPYPMVVSSRVGATLGGVRVPYGVYYVRGGDLTQAVLSFHIVAAPTFAPQPSDITFSQAGAGNAFTFAPIDPATGTPPIQYSVDAAGDDIVPIDAGGYRANAALRGAVDTAFDAESGVVSAVFSETGKFALRYNATDAYGASVTSEYVTFTIVEAPQFSAPLGTYVFTPGSGGSYTIPLSGGTMLTYSVDPALPSGLTISGVDPAILAQTATASEMALTVYTMQVTDANNAEVEREFAIQVAPALTWTGAGISDEFTFTQTVNTDVTLPQNPDAVAFAARYFLGNNTDGAHISEAALTALGLSASQHPAPYPITVGNLDGATLGARVLQYNIEYTDTAASNGGRAATALTFHIVTAPTFAAIADGDVTFTQDGVNNAYTFAPIDGGGALPIAYTFVLTDVAAIERGGYTDGDSLIAAVITSVDARGGNDGVFGATFANTGKFTLRQTAIDNNGAIATSESVTFTIVARPRFESALTDSLVFVSGGGGAYSFANPASGGVGALTYSSTTLPSGLGISGVHTATISQSGTAAIGASMTYAITATDANGAPGAGNIAIQVVALPTFAQSVYAFTFQQGVSSTFTLPQANGDALHALTYQSVGGASFIDDYAQAGLTFSKQTATAPIVVNNRKDALFTGEGEINFVAYYSANADDTLGKARTVLSFVYQQADAPVFATPQPDVTYTLGTANKVTLVEASNSIGGLTYTLSRTGGTVPAALTLEPSTREMRSTTAIAETDSGEYIATATDENGSSAAVTFNLVVTDIILSASLGPFYFVSGAGGGHNFTARGGGALTYAFAPALPNGLAVVEGNPPALRQTATAAAIGLSTYALTVTDENGATAGAEVTLQVFASAPTFDAAQTIYTFIRGEPQSITLPRVTGDGAEFVTYTLQGGAQAISDYAVAGLTFSKHTAQYPIVITNRLDAMLSGGVSSATFTSYFSTDATSSGKATTLLSFVTIAPNAPVFNAAQTDLALSASRARTITLSRATAAVGVITHTFTRIIGAVPAALDFDGDAHQLRIGTAIAVGDSGDYILHAANALDQTAALTFAITVHPLPTFAVAQLELTFTIGARTSHTLPLASGGGGALAYSMSALPGQLQFDSTVNELLYLGGASPGAQSLTLTVTDTLTATDELNIEVQFVDVPSFANDASALLTNGVSFRVGASIVANTTLPQATAGTPPLTYRLTDGANSSYESTDAAATLSANGITFDATTRIISGTPLAAAVQSFAYHARDRHAQTASHNTTMHSIDSLTLSQENLAVEIAATFALSLNAVNHAIGAITYSLTNLDGSAPSLPSGVAYNAGANQLSGVANAAFTGEFIISAVDGFDNTAAQATFIFSAASLVFMPASASITYTRGAQRFTANFVSSNVLTLPAASGGRGALTYAVATPPPNDIAANVRADQRVFISGIARDLGDFTYVRTVRDIDNRSATFTLAINVVDAPRFDSAQGENRYTISHLHTFTLHPASGGFGALSYWITPPLPNEVQLIQEPPSIIGHPPAVLGATEYTLTAADVNGASVSTELLFDNYDLLFWRAAAQQTFAAGVTFSVDDDDVLLPRPGGGLVPYRYELHGLRGQLSFENQTVNQTLYGPLTITFPSQVTPAPLVTYVAIDANRAAITAVFNLHITPMINPQPMRELTFGVGATTHQLTPLANLRVAAGGEVRYEFSPTPSDVGLHYDAVTHRLMSDDSFTNQPPAILTYSLTAAYVSQAATVAAVTQTIVLQVDADDAPVTPSVSETEIERLREINEVILPEVAAATVAATLGAITERIADFGTTPTTTPAPLVSLGGYAPQMALAQAAKAHADGVLDAKDFLNGSRFVVPVSGARERGGAAVWGGVHYRNIDGGGGDEVVEWRGNVDGMHLGFDYKQNNLLLGIAVAKHNGVFDYTSMDGADGEYDITVDSQYQYIDWQRGDLNLWLSAGGGDGELTITQAGEEYIGDIDMAAAGLGVSDDLSAHLQVRGEWRGAEMKIIGNAAQTLRDQTIRANSVRLLAKWRSRDLSEEHHSFVELGMRNDGGDGDTGAAIESALGWRHLSHRTDLELRAHGVFGRNEYKEWGAYGQLRISGGDDEQGLALRLRPSYGGPTRDFGAIWDVESLAAFDGAQDDSNSDDGVYQWRNESRLSYGIQSGGGLFAPFGEVITADANDIYRLGVDWSPHRHFDLNLTGEHRRNENQLGERRILLRGEVAF